MRNNSFSKFLISTLMVTAASNALARPTESTGNDIVDAMGDTAMCAGDAAVGYADYAEKQAAAKKAAEAAQARSDAAQAKQAYANKVAQQNADLSIFTAGLSQLQGAQQRIEYAAAVLKVTLQDPQNLTAVQAQLQMAIGARFNLILNPEQVGSLVAVIVRQ